MSEEENIQLLFDVPLEIDDKEVERRDPAIIADQAIHVLLRENRLALSKGKTSVVPVTEGAEEGKVYYDVPLTCVAHSHPKCRFRSVRLKVDLRLTDGVRICDMHPRKVEGDKPVELRRSLGVGLTFDIVAKVISAEPSLEITSSRTMYYPKIVASGVGLRSAIWDFLALESNYLTVDDDLVLRISAPAGNPVLARFDLRATVTVDGILSIIPLLTRSPRIEETYRLA